MAGALVSLIDICIANGHLFRVCIEHLLYHLEYVEMQGSTCLGKYFVASFVRLWVPGSRRKRGQKRRVEISPEVNFNGDRA